LAITIAESRRRIQGTGHGAVRLNGRHDVQEAPKASMRRLADRTRRHDIEWYDFFCTERVALVFPKLFFAQDMAPLVALIASSARLPSDFARPVGGTAGHFGDVAAASALARVADDGGATTLIGFATLCNHRHGHMPRSAALRPGWRSAQWGAHAARHRNAPVDQRGFYGAFARQAPHAA
jgi:hypothetical protein